MRKYMARGLALVVLASLGAAQPNYSASSDTRQTVINHEVSAPKHAKPYQIGTASWYGDYFEGKQTASGEPFNMYDLTAAHPSLPLGTMVKVTNLRNREAVIVKINDRGPVVPGRIIDLSYGAAQVLRFKDQGIQRVRLDVVHPGMVSSRSNSANPRPQIIAALAPIER